jgi:hypothetical protein
VLQALGFRPWWREWVSILLHTALLNGQCGSSFSHGKGVHQGDPLSPMLFILAMNPFRRLLDLATREGILSPLPPIAAKWRISMYADDATSSLTPLKRIWKQSK